MGGHRYWGQSDSENTFESYWRSFNWFISSLPTNFYNLWLFWYLHLRSKLGNVRVFVLFIGWNVFFFKLVTYKLEFRMMWFLSVYYFNWTRKSRNNFHFNTAQTVLWCLYRYIFLVLRCFQFLKFIFIPSEKKEDKKVARHYSFLGIGRPKGKYMLEKT